jgi:hypothetical protein
MDVPLLLEIKSFKVFLVDRERDPKSNLGMTVLGEKFGFMNLYKHVSEG